MSRDGALPPTAEGVELWCDLLCPDCASVLDDIERLQEQVEVRFRHFPLVRHTWAVPAAQIAEEARVQGVLWPVVSAILASNADLSSPDDLVRVAQRGGASPTALRRALADGRHAGTVARDYHDGRALGITGTPTFVVQGLGAPVRLDGGRSQHGLREAVEALLDVFAGLNRP
jgi:predicted DsbA family dithiol-disulfide isomerase